MFRFSKKLFGAKKAVKKLENRAEMLQLRAEGNLAPANVSVH